MSTQGANPRRFRRTEQERLAAAAVTETPEQRRARVREELQALAREREAMGLPPGGMSLADIERATPRQLRAAGLLTAREAEQVALAQYSASDDLADRKRWIDARRLAARLAEGRDASGRRSA